jgi:hypothetical protein
LLVIIVNFKGFIMDVGATGSMQQMQTQMQTRKMDGSGGGQGQGQGGMKSMMEGLSAEDQATMQDQLSSMSQADRSAMVSQMQEVDSTSMSSEDYTQTLLDMLNEPATDSTSSAAYDFSTYA